MGSLADITLSLTIKWESNQTAFNYQQQRNESTGTLSNQDISSQSSGQTGSTWDMNDALDFA